MSEQQQRQAARDFANYWKDRGDEKSETQQFWMALLGQVFGFHQEGTEIRTLFQEMDWSR